MELTALSVTSPIVAAKYVYLGFALLIWLISLVAVAFLTWLILRKGDNSNKSILQRQKDFMDSISQELKSSLSDIIGYAEMLKKEHSDNNELSNGLEAIRTDSFRMAQLINNMQLLAFFNANVCSINIEKIDIDMLMASLYEAYEPVCTAQRIALELQLGDIDYPTFYSDKERITQILNIFLDNAIYHSISSPSIQITAFCTNKAITFYVIDHGCGILDEDKPHIFDPIYCGNKSRVDKSHIGLGLSIAKSYAQTLDGKIGLLDTAGGGTTFYITIPLNRENKSISSLVSKFKQRK